MNLIEQIKRHEGFKSKAYLCPAGKWTVGYGRNFEDNWFSKDELIRLNLYDFKKAEAWDKLKNIGISLPDAEYLLMGDINRAIADVRSHIDWYDGLPETVQDVLINMTFNLGIGGLLKFKKTLELIHERKYEEAAQEMLKSKWATQVGQRAIELSNQLKEAVNGK